MNLHQIIIIEVPNHSNRHSTNLHVHTLEFSDSHYIHLPNSIHQDQHYIQQERERNKEKKSDQFSNSFVFFFETA